MFRLNSKYEAALLGLCIALMIIVDYFMANTQTNELSARGIMGYWRGYVGLYEAVVFGFPVISIPIVLRFTNRLRKAGLENKWALGLIRYGLLVYFLKAVLLILLLLIMAIFGVGISI